MFSRLKELPNHTVADQLNEASQTVAGQLGGGRCNNPPDGKKNATVASLQTNMLCSEEIRNWLKVTR